MTLEDGRILRMKSHDCHVFVPTFHGIVDELSRYFKQLCSKTLIVDDLDQMRKSIAITLCKLERLFVPTFFDVMVHSAVHLAIEAKLAGPMQYRWMYQGER